MPSPRVMVIGLDGFAIDFAERMMADGDLPALRALAARSSRFLLDHGPAARTGLAWEHFASGLTPEAGARASMVTLDPATYDVWQEGARFVPFVERLPVRSVVFDVPYADLARAPHARGVVGWGAHDPGVTATAEPPDLLVDPGLAPYPSSEWTYATPWASPARIDAMGDGLVRALDARRNVARWLLDEQFDDWELAVMVAGEPHTAAEALWHGIDRDHPLHEVPSSVAAAKGMAAVYTETDRFVGDLVENAGEAAVLVFSMGGMGANDSDVASMILLPELIFRWAGHDPLLTVPKAWSENPRDVPLLSPEVSWGEASTTWYGRGSWRTTRRGVALRRSLGPLVRRFVGARARTAAANPRPLPPGSLDLGWHPAARYRPYWPQMAAFALPSFYDGRIRVNLVGRERDGTVELAEYEGVCDAVEELVRTSRDPRTEEPVVGEVRRVATSDPRTMRPDEADLIIEWGRGVCAFEHPDFGVIGPVPYRRTGGHTGPYGFAYVADGGVPVGDGGVRSAFDVAPTVVDLLGCEVLDGMCGTSLLREPDASAP